MKNRGVRRVLGVVVLVVAILAGSRWFSNERFTKEKWINATPEMRDRLLQSLARSGILNGRTEQNVYEMLGEPDGASDGRVWYCRKYYDENGELKNRFAGMSKCLYISFQDGQVAKAEFTGS